MQKNIQKRLIMLMLAMVVMLTFCGFASAATDATDLSLSVSPTTVNVGDSVTFTARLTRHGTSDGINDQTIHFFVDGVDNGTATTQGLGSNRGTATYTYTPSTSGTKTVQARYYGISDPDGYGPQHGYNPSNSSTRPLTVNTPPSANVTMNKTANGNVANAQVNVGQTGTFTTTVINNGPNSAQGVWVNDPLPTGWTVSYLSLGTTYNSVTGNWSIGTLTNGQSVTLTMTRLINAADAGTTFINTAVEHQTTYNPTTILPQTATVYVNKAVLGVTKSADKASYNVGDLVKYTVHVVNAGPDTATNVVVTDTLPAGLTFVGASNGGTFNAGVITWTLSSLAKNAAYDLYFNATVNSGTQGLSIPNVASALCDQNTTNVVSAPVSVHVNNAPLTVTKTVDKNPANYNVGDSVIYTVHVTNGGPDAATNVVVTDTLPVGLTFVSASNGGVYNDTTRMITWTLGNLASGANFTLYVNATVTADAAAKTLNNTANATNDQMGSPVSATASIYVPSAELVLTKTVDNTKPVVKDIVIFTLIVNNHGPDTSTNVQVADKLPQGLTFVKYVASTGTYDPATGIWTIGDLKNGETAWINITSTVDQIGTITNKANVTSLTYDPNIEGSSASASIDAQQSQSGGGGVDPDNGSGNGSSSTYSSVGAATVAMQETGVPIGMIVTALLMLLTGLVMPRRK